MVAYQLVDSSHNCVVKNMKVNVQLNIVFTIDKTKNQDFANT